MRKLILTILAAVALALPAISEARVKHTGNVICDSRGVVFTYNANFEQDTWVTETVGGAIRVEQVHRKQMKVDIWAGITGTVQAGATWKGGGIKTVTLTCPKAPPPPPVAPPPPVTPPPAPPVAPPPPPVAPPAPPATPVTPPVTPQPTVPVTPPATAKCPPGTTRTVKGHKKAPYNAKLGILTCYKVIHVHHYHFIPKESKSKVKGVEKRISGGVTG